MADWRRSVYLKLLAGMLTTSALLLFGQVGEKTTPKPFQVPEMRAVDPLVASDEGCAKDLAKAGQLEGLEQRKLLFDLFFYGCVRRFDGPYYVHILDIRDIGPAKIPFRKVHLINATDGKTADGWMSAREMFDVSVIHQVLEQEEKNKR